ncbi:Ubiquitin interacting motif [Phaffia rhodozyma]|uniref:Ubiquitin interacting motif n=1 Tax=Phaffia rhodozyma TaxID=264483 RepID=A0A0F7SIL5_PHARH|nr:Ubiquitin interacting motif [Phaffia rhodozyma]
MASTSQSGPNRELSPNRPSAIASGSASAPALVKQVANEPVDAAHDWQTGFIWAFIAKFHPNMIGKNGLGTAMDLEQALHNDGQSDSLSYAFQKFLQCLNPTVTDRNINFQTVPRYLVRTIDNYLKLDRQSLYHPAYLSHHDPPRAPLPTQAEEDEWRKGLNPLRALFRLNRAEGEVSEGAKGGEDAVGSRVWSLGWKGKLKLLRQLVDWQLYLAPSVRDTINLHYKVVSQRQTDFHKDTNPLIVEPLGIDRSKKRYWLFDDSPRVYTSSNPFKKSCPLVPISSTQIELESVINQLRAEPSADKSAQTGNAKTKAVRKKAEEQAREKELWMATFLEQEHMPKIEKERARQEKARRKLETQAIMQAQAANRTTRTRTRQQAHRPSYAEFDRNLSTIAHRTISLVHLPINSLNLPPAPRTIPTPTQTQTEGTLTPTLTVKAGRTLQTRIRTGISVGQEEALDCYPTLSILQDQGAVPVGVGAVPPNGHSNGNGNGKKRGFVLDDEEDEQLAMALAESKALAESQARARAGADAEGGEEDDKDIEFSNGRKKGRYIDPDGEDKDEEGRTDVILVEDDDNRDGDEKKPRVHNRMGGVIEIID